MWRALRERLSPAVLARSFAALRDAQYRRWSIAAFVSGSGGTASTVAIAWLVVELGGDGVAFGAIVGVVMLPTLLAGSFAGMFVDRFSRRSVLLATHVLQMLVAAALAVLSFTGTAGLPALFALSLVQGLAFAADNPARQLLVLDLVGPEGTTSAVSMNEVVINASRIFGPAVAGAILAVGDPGWCFVFNAVSFLPSLVVLLRLRVPRISTERVPDGMQGRAPAAAHRPRSPWRFAMGTPRIRTTLLLAIGAAASYNIAVVMPLMASDVFHAGGGGYAAIAVAFGVGALPGALLSATGPAVPRSEEVRALAVALAGAVLLAAWSPVLGALLVTIALAGATSMWFIARANALVLLETPAAMRGRVMGIWAMMLPGSTVITGLLIGGLADLAGPRVAYAAVAVFLAVVVAVGWRALRTADV
ncbi:MFS transporter [Microbacterium hydrocarbonoxydans]|uniref:MFS transporter n=1 Tax=Microbacterium hydrocarbonoxydans TaxID=273678 RepID=UPI0013DB0489|nr:MFS transporter [Microbacterium hydrocarbonoxydans]